MGNKDAAKREHKEEPQPKPKPAAGRKREDFSQVAVRIVREATEKI